MVSHGVYKDKQRIAISTGDTLNRVHRFVEALRGRKMFEKVEKMVVKGLNKWF